MKKLLIFLTFVVALIALSKIVPPDRSSPEAALAAVTRPAPEDTDTIKFNADDYYKKIRVRRGQAEVEACFDRAMLGFLQSGITSKAQILDFAKSTCGAAYKNQLVFEGASENAAAAFVGLLAEQHLEVVIARVNR